MSMTAKLMPAMLIAAVCALPALAQHVTRPEITDIQNAVNAGFEPTEWQQMTFKGMTSSMLEGKTVMFMNGRSLGYILAVNDVGHVVELQMPGDRAISLPESSLRVGSGKVYVTGWGWRGRTAAVNRPSGTHG